MIKFKFVPKHYFIVIKIISVATNVCFLLQFIIKCKQET